MTNILGLHDIVAVLHDIPEFDLITGHVGVIVEIFNDGEAYEVDFAVAGGAEQVYRLHTLTANQIEVLVQGTSWSGLNKKPPKLYD